MRRLYLVLLCSTLGTVRGLHPSLLGIYEAKNIEFWFPSATERNEALNSGKYNPDSAIPLDVDVYYEKEYKDPVIFITIPRFGKGIPYSLGYLTSELKANGSEIKPYPNYYWHKTHGDDCNGLTSVYRIQIDSCGRLWVLDSGEIDFIQYCAPQVVAFDLKTAGLIHRYVLPKSNYKTNNSRFVTPVLDIQDPGPLGKCNDMFVYMADSIGNGLVVYDVKNQRSWRIENKFTYPHQDFGTFTINGESFELWDGILSMAVAPRLLGGVNKMLYFHSLSNDLEVAIPLSIVRNGTMWAPRDISAGLNSFIQLGRRGTQCVVSAMSEQGFLVCGFIQPLSLVAWNIRLPYVKENMIPLIEDPVTLQFVSGLKIIKNNEGKEEIWALSNRLQKAFGGTLNYNEINFRIQKYDFNKLLRSY